MLSFIILLLYYIYCSISVKKKRYKVLSPYACSQRVAASGLDMANLLAKSEAEERLLQQFLNFITKLRFNSSPVVTNVGRKLHQFGYKTIFFVLNGFFIPKKNCFILTAFGIKLNFIQAYLG